PRLAGGPPGPAGELRGSRRRRRHPDLAGRPGDPSLGRPADPPATSPVAPPPLRPPGPGAQETLSPAGRPVRHSARLQCAGNPPLFRVLAKARHLRYPADLTPKHGPGVTGSNGPGPRGEESWGLSASSWLITNQAAFVA